MSSYKDLQTQIADLQKKAEQVRVQEMNGGLAQIRDLMHQYGITVEDLMGKKSASRNTSKSGATKIQFKDGDKTWSGRGREPSWLKGKDREQFRVKE